MKFQSFILKNKKKQDAYSKKSRLSFLGVLIASKNWPASNPGPKEFNFLKYPCESGLMDFSMKCKSFPLLAYDKIQSFKLK